MRRLFWLVAGAGVGATATITASRWIRRQKQRLAPANVGRRAAEASSDFASRLAAAAADYRSAKADREAEVIASMPSPSDDAGDI